jgi:hypothetical protein
MMLALLPQGAAYLPTTWVEAFEISLPERRYELLAGFALQALPPSGMLGVQNELVSWPGSSATISASRHESRLPTRPPG